MRSRSNLFFGLLFILIAGFAFAFSQKTSLSKFKKYDPNTLVRPAYSDKDFEKLWKRVDSLQGKGLYASALDLCDKILKDASAQNIPTQVVKAVMHKMKFASYIKEEDYVLSIAELEKISAGAKHPLKQIIHSVTAQVYYGYYQRNRWKFYNRSTTVEFKNDDISTWDLKTLSKKVITEYAASLSEPDLSKTTSIESFKYILQDYYEDGVR
ncbi:MAG TPA: hypothetical protein VD905_09115, partial [Flavobacteriales bacterium]|nr:hypothetical protein [Flavobacteriales bacterium]